jgi:DNA-binding IclR family transcriptional regulator
VTESRGKAKRRAASPQVNSVVYALATLRVVAASTRPLGVTEIARETEINLSSCFNILKTLVAEGFLTFDPKTKKYSLGSGALELSNRARDAYRLFNDVRQQLVGLANRYKLTVGFWEIRDTRVLLSGVIGSDTAISIQMTPGQRLPLGSGAIGRAIASARRLHGADLAAHVANVKWHRRPILFDYANEIRQAEAVGWFVDSGQFLAGVMTIAAAILAGPQDPQYALTASGFVGQFDDDTIERIGRDTRRLAHEIQTDWFGHQEQQAPA